MTPIPMLPDLEPDYERTIEALIAEREDALAAGDSNRSWELMCDIEDRNIVLDAILLLNDQLNDAGLVIVPLAEWEVARVALEVVTPWFDEMAENEQRVREEGR